MVFIIKYEREGVERGGETIECLYPGAELVIPGKEMKIFLKDEGGRFNIGIMQAVPSQEMFTLELTETESLRTVREIGRKAEEAHDAPPEYLSDNGSVNKGAHCLTAPL